MQTAVCEQLQQKIVNLQGVEKQFNAVKAVIKAKQEVVVPLIQAVQDREYWVQLVEDLNSRLPERSIWVTSMELEPVKPDPAAAGKAKTPKLPVLILKGFYVDNPKGVGIVDDFANALAKSTLYTVHPDKDRPPLPPDDWAAAYTIRLSLKKPFAQ